MADSGCRLLVVDDNKVNRLLLSRSLEQMGHRVASAENGVVALAKLRAEPFDLMLLDMEMPEMDGFAVLEHLSRDLRLRDVPVIVTSSLEGVAHVARCIELGAEDYLYKPVNGVLLKARVDSSLEKKRLRDRQKELISRFATSEVAQDLEQSGFALGGRHVEASVMFCDIRGFTALAESLPPDETIDLLNTWYTLMFDAINGAGGVVNQIIGDGLMAIFGAPLPLPDYRRGAVRAALEMIELVDLFNLERRGGPQGADRDRHRHRVGSPDRRLHRHAESRDLHVRRRHRESRGAPRVAHEGGGARDPDGRGHARRGPRRPADRGARTGVVQGQGRRGRRVRDRAADRPLTPVRRHQPFAIAACMSSRETSRTWVASDQ